MNSSSGRIHRPDGRVNKHSINNSGVTGGLYGAINILGIGMRKYEASVQGSRTTLGTLTARKPHLAKAVVYAMMALIIVLMAVATLIKY